MNVLVPLADGVEELEAVTIIDVLRRGGVNVTSAAISGKNEVAGSRGVSIAADTAWDTVVPENFDAIVLPGGGAGTDNLIADKRIRDTLRNYNAEGKWICAICAAPMVLAAAGVILGRKVTCYPSCASSINGFYEDAPVIADGNLITSQGPGTALLFALVLVKHFTNDENARKVAAGMLTGF